MVGLASPAGAVNQIKEMSTVFTNMNGYELILSIATVAIIYIVPRITKAVPSTLIALIIVTAASAFVPFKEHITFITSMQSGIPTPKLMEIPSFTSETFGIVLKYGAMFSGFRCN